MEKIVLDTHILVDLVLREENLSKSILEKIYKHQKEHLLYISSITLWEVAMLIDKKRINVYESIKDFLERVSNLQGLEIIDLSASVASESVLLNNFHGDPADRIITATTKVIAGTLITRDRKILDWASQGYIRVIEG
jgi:PIN domain nuclease of toxin-antitoxin system